MHSTHEESFNLLQINILVECSYSSFFFFTTDYIATLSLVQAHTFYIYMYSQKWHRI